MRVSVCMIVRNEAATLETAVKSVHELADELIILDTGSDDGTVDLAYDVLGAKVLTGGDRMHKGQARNQAIEAASGDWVVILDADERIADPVGLRTFLETTDAQAVFIKLTYMNADNQPTLSFSQQRCWRRGTYLYKYRAHEVPLPVDSWGKQAYTDFVWEHRPPSDRLWKSEYTRDRLLLDIEENPGETRPLYYLGRQYMYRKEWQEAIDTLQQYLEKSGRDESDAWHCLSVCHNGLGDKQARIKALYQAVASQANRREWWCELAGIYHADGKDNVALGLLKCALEQPMPERSYVRHGWYGAAIYDLTARCLWKLGRYEEGYGYAQKAVDLKPGSQRLKDNLGWFEEKLGCVPVTKVFITGCAKSGTTLLKNLFHAFKDVEVMPGEPHITRFCQQDSAAKFLVGKRHRYSLFSEHLSPAQMESQLGLVKKHSVKIVNIVRDGRDVVFSDHKNVSPRRWIAAMRQREEYQDLISVELRYEDIVRKPDETQKRLAKTLGLGIEHLWSEYPSFVPEREFSTGVYSKRPLTDESVGKGLPYQELIDDIAQGFEQELEKANYVVSAQGKKMDDFYLQCGPDIHKDFPRHKAIAKLVEGPNVLDVGCGTGDLLLLLQEQDGIDLYGFDISRVAIDMARARGVTAFLSCSTLLTSVGIYDTVVMSQVLEHVNDDVVMVKSAAKRLTSRGKLIVTVPRDGRIPSSDHKREYTEESLTELLSVVGPVEIHSWPGEKYRILATARNE